MEENLELKIKKLSQAINMLKGNEDAIEIIKHERSHYLFMYEKKNDICYFEKEVNDYKSKENK